MTEPVAPAAHAGFQYHNRDHEAATALSGMWLFLATEILLFGGLVFVWTVYRFGYPAAFSAAADHTNLLIGSLNTAILLTSSAIFTTGVNAAERGRNDRLLRACWITAALASAFLALKALEWGLDFREHLFPGPTFAIPGPNHGGAQLFFSIYFIVTGLHAIHMIVGIGLIAWVGFRARRNDYTRLHHTQVQVVGLYWSFVDLVWLTFYPLLYLIARP